MTARYHDDRRPEQIEDDIEHTRADLSETLDAIERKLSPSQIVDQATDYFFSGPGEFGSNLTRQIKANPIPVALIGIGLAWLVLSSQRQRRPAAYDAAPAADRFRLRDQGYGDPYRSYGDDERVGGAYGSYAEGYGRYEGDDERRYGAYHADDEDRYAEEGAWARRRAGVHHDEPAPGSVRRDDPLSSARAGPVDPRNDPLSARVDPLSSATGAAPLAGEPTDDAAGLGRPSTTTTHRTTEERL